MESLGLAPSSATGLLGKVTSPLAASGFPPVKWSPNRVNHPRAAATEAKLWPETSLSGIQNYPEVMFWKKLNLVASWDGKQAKSEDAPSVMQKEQSRKSQQCSNRSERKYHSKIIREAFLTKWSFLLLVGTCKSKFRQFLQS